MDKQFEIMRKTRQFVLNLVGDLTTEQLNLVPLGFNNNIIWNLAHLIAAQQGVCYFRGGLPMVVKEDFFLAYKPDTKPAGAVDEGTVEEIKKMLLSSIDQLQADYTNGLFKNNPAWTNRYGVEHLTIEDSINFLLFHDGLHTGYIMALKRVVKNN